jgi:hypothetical protein
MLTGTFQAMMGRVAKSILVLKTEKIAGTNGILQLGEQDKSFSHTPLFGFLTPF